MNKKLASIILFFCLIFSISISAFSQNYDNLFENLFPGERQKYYDFTDIYVLVEDLQENVKKVGLTTNQIQTDIEIRLQRAGLKINKDAKQTIYVNVNSINIDSYSMAYSIHISLQQNAVLSRDKSLSSDATTWSVGQIGVMSNSNTRKIRDTISDFVDEFINKYLKYQSEIKDNKNLNSAKGKPTPKTKKTPVQPTQPLKKEEDSPFTATYVGGNSPPEIEILMIQTEHFILTLDKAK